MAYVMGLVYLTPHFGGKMFAKLTLLESAFIYTCICSVPFGIVKIGELVYYLMTHLAWVN